MPAFFELCKIILRLSSFLFLIRSSRVRCSIVNKKWLGVRSVVNKMRLESFCEGLSLSDFPIADVAGGAVEVDGHFRQGQAAL